MTTPTPPEFGSGSAGSSRLLGSNGLQQAIDALTTAVNSNTQALQQAGSSKPGGTTVPYGSTGQSFTSGAFPKMAGGIFGGGGTFSGQANATQPGGGGGPAGNLQQMGGAAAGAAASMMTSSPQFSNQILMNQYASMSTLGMAPGTNMGRGMRAMYTQAFGTYNNNLNAIANSPADAAQMYSNLQGIAASPYVMATAQGRAGFGAAAGFGIANPALGGAGASAAAAQLYSGQTSFAMRQLGYGATPRAGMGQGSPLQSGQVMQAILQRAYGKGSVGQGTLNAGLANNGKLQLNLQALGLDPNTMGPALQMYNKLFQQGLNPTQAQGLLNAASQNKDYQGQSAQKTLSNKYGIATSDLQKLKDTTAVKTGTTSGEMSGFDSAVSQATTSLQKFDRVLNTILKDTGIGSAIGAMHGASGVMGAVGGAVGGLFKSTVGMLSRFGGAGGAPAASTGHGTPGSTTGKGGSKAAQTAIKDAESQVGRPYVWGGDNPAVGFDCSGLVEWAYGQAGIKLPRTSQEQWAALKGRSVSLSKVQAGDILFSAGSDGTPNNPGHEAMAISSSQIVEAPYCVPTDTEILTRRGWVKYDDLYSDDETLGYNLETKKLEWTTVIAVHVFDDVPVMRAGTKTWNVEATANHRWVNQSKLGIGLVPMNEMVQGSHMILSAPADTDDYLEITEVEAELLAWAEGDGSIRVRGGTLELNITQANPEWVTHIQKLLTGVPHTESVRKKDPRAHNVQHVWYFPAKYARDLLSRAEYFDLSPSEMILAMSPSQRAAWLRGMWGAEGSKTRVSSTMVVTQNDGPVQDAIALCMYLLGHRPRYWKREPGRHCRKVTATNPRLHIQDGQFSVEPSRNADVWCPTTGLGTWTARQGDHIFVTGNTGANIRIRALDPGEWMHAARPSGSTAGGGSSAGGGTTGTNGQAKAATTTGHGNSGLGLSVGNYGSSDEVANIASALLGGISGGSGGGPSTAFSASNVGNGQGTTSKSSGKGNLNVSTAGGGSISANRALGQRLAKAMYGWTGSQWAALDKLWGTYESGWNNEAQNPSSSAFGIAQFLDSTWRGYGQKTSNAGLQIKYGMEYIHDSYKDPVHALQFELSHTPHWYGAGTDSARGGLALLGERGPELVRLGGGQQVMNASQTADILSGSHAKPAQAMWSSQTARELCLAASPQNAAHGRSGKAEIHLNMPQGAIVIHTTGSSSDVSSNVRQIMNGVSQAMSDDETLKKIMQGVTS